MSESESLLPLSKKSKEIMEKIRSLATRFPSLLKIDQEAILVDSSSARRYDLRVREHRDAYENKCQAAIGYSMYISVGVIQDQRRKTAKQSITHISDTNFGDIQLNVNRFDPWLSLLFLLNDLTFQIETQDLIDELG